MLSTRLYDSQNPQNVVSDYGSARWPPRLITLIECGYKDPLTFVQIIVVLYTIQDALELLSQQAVIAQGSERTQKAIDIASREMTIMSAISVLIVVYQFAVTRVLFCLFATLIFMLMSLLSYPMNMK
jgi:uncharacterized membrane protein